MAETSTPDIEVIPDGQVTDPSEARSALEENILSKGKHSYYYAHKSNLGVGGDTKNYGTPPRLLSVSEIKIKGTGRPLKIITDYAWADSGKKVKVYIEIEGIVELTDDSVELVHTKTSFNLKLNNLNEKGKKIFNEIFELQKKRVYSALLNSSSEEVINFDNVLSKIING